MTDLSVTQYNPYNMYQNFGYYPAFKGATIQQNNYNSVPQMTLQPDTVSFSANGQIQAETKQEGLSKGAKWGIGAGVALGLGALAYVLTRGKSGSKQVQQLTEHLDFKPAKTIKEAKSFAKDRLGVHYNEIEDLETINFFNEWLTGIHNKCKVIDKSSYPKFISNYSKLEGDTLACLCDDVLKYGNQEGYVMGVNMPLIKNFGTSMDRWICDGSVIAKNKAGKYVITNNAYDTEFTRSLVKRMNEYNPNTTTLKEKNRIILDIMGLQDGKMVNGKIQAIRYDDFHYLNHELGHLRHQECVNNYNLMKKIEEYKTMGQSVSDITKEFVTDKQIQQTARKVSDYATESPLEFVAETFSQLMEGKTFPEDVMALYKKYGGPSIS